MDVEGWIIEQLEPVITAPEAPAEVTMVGPAKLVVRAEVDWFEADGPDHPCRGVDVEVSVGGEPIASFGYTVSERGERNLLDHIGRGEAALITRIVQSSPSVGLILARPQF